MAGIFKGFSGAFQALRNGAGSFVRASQEARAKAAANSLEQNKAKVTTTAADFVAVTTTYVPQVEHKHAMTILTLGLYQLYCDI